MPQITDKIVVAELKKHVKAAGSQQAFAAKMHVSAQFVSDVLRSQRGIPAAWAELVGYRKEWVKV